MWTNVINYKTENQTNDPILVVFCASVGIRYVNARMFSIVLQKNLMWNTVTVQYNPLIEEEWDEHFKVTCEYGYDFWKTVTFPFLDVEYVCTR